MGYSQFDYTLAADSARAQRRVLRERKKEMEKALKAAYPVPPMSFTSLFKITPIRLETQ
jgi:hypothetical protein